MSTITAATIADQVALLNRATDGLRDAASRYIDGRATVAELRNAVRRHELAERWYGEAKRRAEEVEK